MSSPDNLLKATLNRLGNRIGQKLIDSVSELVKISKDAPEKFRTEWELFQEEVIEEANRLDDESREEVSNNKNESKGSEFDSPQDKIDQIRTKVSALNSKLETKN